MDELTGGAPSPSPPAIPAPEPVPGDALRPWRLAPVSAAAMVEWADILDDPNPIHLDPALVERLGLGRRTINQGPANLAYAINMLAANFPGGTIGSLAAKFLGNVFSGDSVEAVGRILTVEPLSAGRRVRCEVQLIRGDGSPALQVTATVDLPGGDVSADLTGSEQ